MYFANTNINSYLDTNIYGEKIQKGEFEAK